MRIAALALIVASSAAFAADEDPIENPRLPRMWKLVERRKIPAEQVEALSKKLDLPMKSLENSVIDAGGIGVKVNIARCEDETQAEALRKRFVVIHGGDDLYAMRRGCDVAEISCTNRAVARKARDVLGWPGASLRSEHVFDVKMQVAPLVRCDGMRWNRLFNLLSKSDDPKFGAAIEAEAKSFEFADRLPDASADAPPAPRVHGVPCVPLRVICNDLPFQTRRVPEHVDTWTAATDAWPTKAPEVQKALAEALGDKPRSGADATARRRVEDVLAWVHAHVRYGGDEVGSRYGVAKVIAQGYGHCWDQSDVFVTLCRAAGVPARQVGGWLYHGEGHVWAEVVVDDELVVVDPGTTWLGVSEDYLRLWESADGRAPFVYWGPPKIEGPFLCIR